MYSNLNYRLFELNIQVSGFDMFYNVFISYVKVPVYYKYTY